MNLQAKKSYQEMIWCFVFFFFPVLMSEVFGNCRILHIDKNYCIPDLYHKITEETIKMSRITRLSQHPANSQTQ